MLKLSVLRLSIVTNNTFFGPGGRSGALADDALAEGPALPDETALAEGAAGAGWGGAGSDLEHAKTKGNAKTTDRMG